LGDNTRYDRKLSEITDIDYLFLSMGKMSFEDMVQLIQDINPGYIVPMHFKPSRGAFLTEYYPSPQDPDRYIQTLRKKIDEAGLKTEVLVLYPGQERRF
ncbi:MAG: hypothetical protein KKC84_06550, partial [Candidatus Omnitrophica bacterium]|nr:hypothetical protein [Candidatus Omnitrophota bacterium]